MSYDFTSAIGFSILVAMLIGLIRIRKINRLFFPFVGLLSLGFLSEAISFVVVTHQHSNALVYNSYVLLEACLIIWQLHCWKLARITRQNALCLIAVLLVVWIIENFFFSSIYSFNSYFIILYSFLVVLLTIRTLNTLIVTERTGLLKNAVFLICLGFLVYFTYSIMIEIFWMYGLDKDPLFQSRVYDILVVINLFVNLIFALAALWIPIKQKFILLS